MEFERAVNLLVITATAEVPVLASVYGQPEPWRFLLKRTSVEGKWTTLHLTTYAAALPCPLSPHITSQQRHNFNNPSSAPATSPIHDTYRTIRVLSGRSGRNYFCHETRLDSDVRFLLRNSSGVLRKLRKAGVPVFKL